MEQHRFIVPFYCAETTILNIFLMHYLFSNISIVAMILVRQLFGYQ